jgi:hypothetical protein
MSRKGNIEDHVKDEWSNVKLWTATGLYCLYYS